MQSMQLCVERKEGCKAIEDTQGDLVVGLDSYAYYRGGTNDNYIFLITIITIRQRLHQIVVIMIIFRRMSIRRRITIMRMRINWVK